jgi:hypothetical protein
MMLGRLERAWLSEEAPPRGSGGLRERQDDADRGLARWARPWGVAPRMKLDSGMARADAALVRLARWLPAGAVLKAERRARDRFEAIASRVLEEGPQARALTEAAEGVTMGERPDRRPSRIRLAAIAGLVLLPAGIGAFLLVAHTAGGPTSPPGPRVAGDETRRQPAVDTADRTGPSRPAPRERSGETGKRRAGKNRPPPQSVPEAPVVAEAAPAPALAVAEQPPAATPSSAPPSPAPAPQPSPAKNDEGGSGCPPEFGYEC